MPTIEELNQKHPSYDIDRILDLEALYRGDVLFEKRLKRFLPEWEREHPERYALRKKLAHYRNYLSVVIDYFAALLFAGKVVTNAKDENGDAIEDPEPYYSEFREDCDGDGKDIEAFFKERLTDAMVHGCSWFRIEHPSDDGMPAENRAEFEERKLGNCEVAAIPVSELYDWEVDSDGRLEWALEHSLLSKRSSLTDGRFTCVERWTHYQPDRVDVYGITYDKRQPPTPTTVVPRLPDESYEHKFGCVPVMCLDLPVGLWAANRLKTPQLAHFRASNAQTWSLANSAFAMMVFQVANPEAFAKVQTGPARGFVLGIGETAAWIAPPAAHFAALDEEIKAQKDEIFRLAHQMALGVENNAAAIGRSAQSKAADSEVTRVVVEAYGELVSEAIERIYDLISLVRGDNHSWNVDGLGTFATVDVGGLLTSLESVDKIGGIPSVTWNALNLSQLASALRPDISEHEKVKIADEIRKSLERSEEQQANQADSDAALLDAAKVHLKGANSKPIQGNPNSGAE